MIIAGFPYDESEMFVKDGLGHKITIRVSEIHEKVYIDTESMGREFFLDLMGKLYDMAEVK